jgi:hypothetical protein
MKFVLFPRQVVDFSAAEVYCRDAFAVAWEVVGKTVVVLHGKCGACDVAPSSVLVAKQVKGGRVAQLFIQFGIAESPVGIRTFTP